jgi:UDP-N-acetylglucosamine 1-carboxyvinyltransferase
MDSIQIKKVSNVYSDVTISGAKNSVLPLLCSSVIYQDSIFSNVPDLSDVKKLLSILTDDLDMSYKLDTHLEISSNNIQDNVILKSPENSKIRYSTLLMGALLGRGCESITIPKSGGCASFGDRPIDIHLEGFKQLGFCITETDTSTIIKGKISSNPIMVHLRFPSVGATINLIFASLKTKQVVTISNVAIEPEIIDLISYLNKKGENITLTDRTVTIKESSCEVKNIVHEVIYDRIEAMSYIVLSTLSKSKMLIKNVPYIYMEQPFKFLESLGVKYELLNKISGIADLRVIGFVPIEGGHELNTSVYPGIGTDYQPVIAPLMLYTGGIIRDEIYPLRFKYLEELRQLGLEAKIMLGQASIESNKVTFNDEISMNSYDLRSGFFNLIIGSVFSKKCTIYNPEQIFRGYEDLERKLSSFGIELN